MAIKLIQNREEIMNKSAKVLPNEPNLRPGWTGDMVKAKFYEQIPLIMNEIDRVSTEANAEIYAVNSSINAINDRIETNIQSAISEIKAETAIEIADGINSVTEYGNELKNELAQYEKTDMPERDSQKLFTAGGAYALSPGAFVHYGTTFAIEKTVFPQVNNTEQTFYIIPTVYNGNGDARVTVEAGSFTNNYLFPFYVGVKYESVMYWLCTMEQNVFTGMDYSARSIGATASVSISSQFPFYVFRTS